MTTQTLTHHDHHNSDSTDIFGFWIYIMSDCILFAAIFATFSVLRSNVYGGPTIGNITNIPGILTETLLLLTSSFTYGLAMISYNKSKVKNVLFWLGITFMLGLAFVALEMNEFINLYLEGHSWQTSGALSAFFTLVGTHGLHVTIGLIWMLVMMIQLPTFEISAVMKRRLTYLGLFWAFLDVIWIFVFTIVYLMGSI